MWRMKAYSFLRIVRRPQEIKLRRDHFVLGDCTNANIINGKCKKSITYQNQRFLWSPDFIWKKFGSFEFSSFKVNIGVCFSSNGATIKLYMCIVCHSNPIWKNNETNPFTNCTLHHVIAIWRNGKLMESLDGICPIEQFQLVILAVGA